MYKVTVVGDGSYWKDQTVWGWWLYFFVYLNFCPCMKLTRGLDRSARQKFRREARWDRFYAMICSKVWTGDVRQVDTHQVYIYAYWHKLIEKKRVDAAHSTSCYFFFPFLFSPLRFIKKKKELGFKELHWTWELWWPKHTEEVLGGWRDFQVDPIKSARASSLWLEYSASYKAKAEGNVRYTYNHFKAVRELKMPGGKDVNVLSFNCLH